MRKHRFVRFHLGSGRGPELQEMNVLRRTSLLFAIATASLLCVLACGGGFISSQDGGNTWSPATTLAGPMSLSWLPNTSSGVMVGDYISTVFSNGHAYGVFAVAQANSGSTFNQSIFTTTNALLAASSQLSLPVMRAESAVTRQSDHGARKFYDLDHEHPVPRRKR